MKAKFQILLRVVTLISLLTMALGSEVQAGGTPVHVEAAAATFPVIADFEGGVPANWFQYGDSDAVVTPAVITINDTDSLALPGQIGANDVLSVTANVAYLGRVWRRAQSGARLEPLRCPKFLVPRRESQHHP